jgi:hypothetical protein
MGISSVTNDLYKEYVSKVLAFFQPIARYKGWWVAGTRQVCGNYRFFGCRQPVSQLTLSRDTSPGDTEQRKQALQLQAILGEVSYVRSFIPPRQGPGNFDQVEGIYSQPYNEIVKPDQIWPVSKYFLRRWTPLPDAFSFLDRYCRPPVGLPAG